MSAGGRPNILAAQRPTHCPETHARLTFAWPQAGTRQPLSARARQTFSTDATHLLLPTVAGHSKQQVSLKCVNPQSSVVRQASWRGGREGALEETAVGPSPSTRTTNSARTARL
jgi:hypothetical protein